MAKKKNKSFVEIKEKAEDFNQNLIDPLKQYEYIEPKKKAPIKQILLLIATIITISLIIIFLKMIEQRNKEIYKPNNTNNQQTNKTNDEVNISPVTKPEKNNREEITETLVCSSSSIEDDLQIDIKVTTNFHDKKLRSDENLMTIKLLNENSKEKFNNYVTTLQMFSLYLMENSNYEITDYNDKDQFSISIKTTYTEDNKIESNLNYDEDYESVKQKLIELGHECK